MNIGIVYGVLAFFLWGVFPAYWKALSGVPPLEILAHRMVWSLFVSVAAITYYQHWTQLQAVFRSAKTLLLLLLTTLLVTGNWFAYIWGVNNGQIVECSLGYFLTPLINLLLGVLVLKERLRPWQIAAFLLASLGVLVRTWQYGHLPFLSLFIASTFAAYGLLRKQISVDSVTAFAVETGLMLIPAAYFLLSLEAANIGWFGLSTPSTRALLIGAGVVSAVPLLLFGEAARRVPLTVLGILQYIAPTGQFILGVFVYNEPFSAAQLIGFVAIWAGLLVFTIEGVIHNRRLTP